MEEDSQGIKLLVAKRSHPGYLFELSNINLASPVVQSQADPSQAPRPPSTRKSNL